MRRRSVVVLFVLIVLLAGGAAALMLTVKPDLDDAHDKTDASWKPLRGPLTARYEQLGAAVIALRATNTRGEPGPVDAIEGLDERSVPILETEGA